MDDTLPFLVGFIAGLIFALILMMLLVPFVKGNSEQGYYINHENKLYRLELVKKEG